MFPILSDGDISRSGKAVCWIVYSLTDFVLLVKTKFDIIFSHFCLALKIHLPDLCSDFYNQYVSWSLLHCPKTVRRVGVSVHGGRAPYYVCHTKCNGWNSPARDKICINYFLVACLWWPCNACPMSNLALVFCLQCRSGSTPHIADWHDTHIAQLQNTNTKPSTAM